MDDDHSTRKMLLDVHLAEFSAVRQLVHTQIQQDRITLTQAVSVIVALVAATGIVIGRGVESIPEGFWIIPASVPAVLSFLGIMNARSIQAGLETTAYVICHLRKEIAQAIGRTELAARILRAEDFFPKVDHLHWPTREIPIGHRGGLIRSASGFARMMLFLFPSVACLWLAWEQLLRGLPHDLTWIVGVLCVASTGSTLLMCVVFAALWFQLRRVIGWTSYHLVVHELSSENHSPQ